MPPDSLEKTFADQGIAVSRETLAKLETYEQLLHKWQKAINLVGPATLTEVPLRHFADSAQLMKHIPDLNIRLADMGSGAGFPGLVLAMLGVADVHLIESDIRKATFLREVSRETGCKVTIHDKRAEDCRIENIDLFTARALAPLRDLLGHMHRLSTEGHAAQALFLKGAQTEEEIDKAAKRWAFDLDLFPSATDTSGRILHIRNLQAK